MAIQNFKNASIKTGSRRTTIWDQVSVRQVIVNIGLNKTKEPKTTEPAAPPPPPAQIVPLTPESVGALEPPPATTR